MRVTERLLAPAPEQTGSSPDHTNWQPLEKAPSESPSCLLCQGAMRRWSPFKTKTGIGR